MKKILIFLGVLGGILGGLFVALPYILPMDTLHSKAITIVNEKTGGDLQINGQTSFSIFPSPGIVLNNISFRTAGHSQTPTQVQAGSIRVSVNFMPLLSKEVEISEFVLYRPLIDIMANDSGVVTSRQPGQRKRGQDKRGQREIQPRDSIGELIDNSSPDMDSSGGSDSPAPLPVKLKNLSLENVRIVDGTIRYTDKKTGHTEVAEKINATVRLKNLDHPLTLKSTLVWHDKTVTVNALLEQSRILLEETRSPVQLAISAPDIDMTFQGIVERSENSALSGKMEISSASVRQLADWGEIDLPVPGGLQALDVKSNVHMTGKLVRLQQMKLTLDQSNVAGHIKLFLNEARPRIAGKLALDQLNLNTYLSKSKVYGWSSIPPEYRVAKNTRNRDGRQSGRNAAERLDFRGLKAVNADLDLTFGSLLYKKIRLGRSDIQLTLDNGILNIDLTDMRLYQGRGTASLLLNGKSARPAVKASFSLESISALPLLKDAADFKWLSGTGDIRMTISGKGKTVTALKKTLSGTGKIKFYDGAIEGVNIAQMMRGVTDGSSFGLSKNTSEKTDFSSMTATFSIRKGVVHNKDLNILSPLLRVSGAGQANLVSERLDYRVEPKIVSSLEGQGGGESRGINIPVNITGPFADPKIRPDLNKILENPKELVRGVKNLGKTFKKLKENKQVIDLLKGLF